MLRLLFLSVFTFFSSPIFSQQSEKVKLLCNWNDTTGLSNHYGQFFNDVWGFTWNRTEYAAIGSTEGVHIIDVNNCKQVAFAKGSSAGPHVIHRDYKTYKNYLYAVCDEGDGSRLQIFDFSYLPDSIHQVFESPAEMCVKSHNIFIDTVKAGLYLCSVKSPGGGSAPMKVYSLMHPADPLFYASFVEPSLLDHVHDVYVRNDTAYCSDGNAGYVIARFNTSPSPYEVLGVLQSYDYKGYNHSSWINTKGIGVMADETHGSPMKVIDTREVNDIKVLSYFMPRQGDTTCIPHNPYILNDTSVLISYYYDGLQIYSIANPDSPYRTGYYDTYPGANFKGYAGAWGCYPYLPSGRILVSDMQTGLYVFDADSALGRLAPPRNGPEAPTVKTLKVYPSPATDLLHISLPDAGDADVAIYDVSGRTLLKQRIYRPGSQAIELTLPRLWPAGLYMVRVSAGRNSYTANFVKADN